MAEPLAVDANCLVSALLGGQAREIVFSPQFKVYSPQATLFEVAKHLKWMACRIGEPEIEVYRKFQLLPVFACQPVAYESFIAPAAALIETRDPLDIPLLALALSRQFPIWSDDRDFEGISEIRLLKTAELLSQIRDLRS